MFEQMCNISNGYLNKQFKGKGSVGSDIVQKIHKTFPDLNVKWVVTGQGDMIIKNDNDPVISGYTPGEQLSISAREEVIVLLRKQIAVLETAVKDKERIITLLEEQLEVKKNAVSKNANTDN